jgi:hypothetical protein
MALDPAGHLALEASDEADWLSNRTGGILQEMNMRSKTDVTEPVPAASRAKTRSLPSYESEQKKSKSIVPEGRTIKAETSRKNSSKSTGPRTPRGKSYSRHNALKHGLYSKELLVSEADRPEFGELSVALMAQLKPSTTFQRLAFDYIVVCHWRSKLALRLEHRQFARQLQDEQREKVEGEAPDVAPVIQRWYGSSPADIRAGIGALEYAIAEFNGHGSFREETKEVLTSGFGPDFVVLLEKWKTMSIDAILLADHLARHREDFGEMPDMDVKSSSPPGEAVKVVIDPMQQRQMVVRLLEERRSYLKELLYMMRRNVFSGNAAAAYSSDFNPRFLADANRELRRALDHYFDLKNKGL